MFWFKKKSVVNDEVHTGTVEVPVPETAMIDEALSLIDEMKRLLGESTVGSKKQAADAESKNLPPYKKKNPDEKDEDRPKVKTPSYDKYELSPDTYKDGGSTGWISNFKSDQDETEMFNSDCGCAQGLTFDQSHYTASKKKEKPVSKLGEPGYYDAQLGEAVQLNFDEHWTSASFNKSSAYTESVVKQLVKLIDQDALSDETVDSILSKDYSVLEPIIKELVLADDELSDTITISEITDIAWRVGYLLHDPLLHASPGWQEAQKKQKAEDKAFEAELEEKYSGNQPESDKTNKQVPDTGRKVEVDESGPVEEKETATPQEKAQKQLQENYSKLIQHITSELIGQDNKGIAKLFDRDDSTGEYSRKKNFDKLVDSAVKDLAEDQTTYDPGMVKRDVIDSLQLYITTGTPVTEVIKDEDEETLNRLINLIYDTVPRRIEHSELAELIDNLLFMRVYETNISDPEEQKKWRAILLSPEAKKKMIATMILNTYDDQAYDPKTRKERIKQLDKETAEASKLGAKINGTLSAVQAELKAVQQSSKDIRDMLHDSMVKLNRLMTFGYNLPAPLVLSERRNILNFLENMKDTLDSYTKSTTDLTSLRDDLRAHAIRLVKHGLIRSRDFDFAEPEGEYADISTVALDPKKQIREELKDEKSRDKVFYEATDAVDKADKTLDALKREVGSVEHKAVSRIPVFEDVVDELYDRNKEAVAVKAQSSWTRKPFTIQSQVEEDIESQEIGSVEDLAGLSPLESNINPIVQTITTNEDSATANYILDKATEYHDRAGYSWDDANKQAATDYYTEVEKLPPAEVALSVRELLSGTGTETGTETETKTGEEDTGTGVSLAEKTLKDLEEEAKQLLGQYDFIKDYNFDTKKLSLSEGSEEDLKEDFYALKKSLQNYIQAKDLLTIAMTNLETKLQDAALSVQQSEKALEQANADVVLSQREWKAAKGDDKARIQKILEGARLYAASVKEQLADDKQALKKTKDPIEDTISAAEKGIAKLDKAIIDAEKTIPDHKYNIYTTLTKWLRDLQKQYDELKPAV